MNLDNLFQVNGLPKFNVRVISFGWDWSDIDENDEQKVLAVWNLEVRSHDGLTAPLQVSLDLWECGVGEEIAAQMALFGVYPEELDEGILAADGLLAGREAALSAPTGDKVKDVFRALAAFRAPTKEQVDQYEEVASVVVEGIVDSWNT